MDTMSSKNSGKIGATIKDFSTKATGIEKGFMSASQEAGERVGELASTIADSASDYLKKSQDYLVTGKKYVKENPLKGISIAIGAGAVAGSLITLVAMRQRR